MERSNNLKLGYWNRIGTDKLYYRNQIHNEGWQYHNLPCIILLNLNVNTIIQQVSLLHFNIAQLTVSPVLKHF